MFLVGYGHIYMFLVGYAKLLNELLPLAVAPGHIYSSVWYEDRCKLSQTPRSASTTGSQPFNRPVVCSTRTHSSIHNSRMQDVV